MKRLLPLAIGVFVLLAGCVSSSAQRADATRVSIVERPPSQAFSEFVRRNRITQRTKELIQTGQYASRREATKAAERENPPQNGPGYSAWSQRHTEALRKKAAQDRFERDLATLGWK